MSCDQFVDRLMDYLEQETDDVTRLGMERHAVTCEDCGPVLADLRKLRIDAANLPVLKPSRDLWAGIAERIETPVVAINGHAERQARRWSARRIVQVGVLAASLVGAAAIGHFSAMARLRVDPGSPAPVARIATDVTPAAPPAAVGSVAAAPIESSGIAPLAREDRAVVAATPAGSAVVRPEIQLAVANLTSDYDREISRLRRLMDARRDQLDPATVAIIERNLAVIDTAIAESKAAIVRDPASRFLIESLNQSLQAKVELMRTAAVLPSRT